jgi:acetyl-CoA C-acetyltransferase
MIRQNIENLPVLIGAGQSQQDVPKVLSGAKDPIDMMAAAIQAALSDLIGRISPDQNSDQIKTQIDRVTAVRLFSDSGPLFPCPFGGSNNVPLSVSKAVGLKPAHLIYTKLGGEQPQVQIAETAKALSRGESEMAVICGGEAIGNMKAALKVGQSLNWKREEALEAGVVFDDHKFEFSDLPIHPEEARHGLTSTIALYALSETARRLKMGLSVVEYRTRIGDAFAPFASVAAQNPYAMFKETLSGREIASPSAYNPILVSPYTKAMVAKDAVNQGAAIIMTTYGRAKAMGLSEKDCVFLNGFAQGGEPNLCERQEIERYPVLDKVMQEAFSSSPFKKEDISHADFYSCFPIVVFNSLPLLDEAALEAPTQTGGLPFFGGPGNNYSLHAISEMVTRLRGHNGVGLVHANGGIMTKHAVGIFSNRSGSFEGIHQEKKRLVPSSDKVMIEARPEGKGRLISFALQYKKGAPSSATLYLEMESGNRALAILDTEDFDRPLTDIESFPRGTIFDVEAGRGQNKARLAS